MDKQNLKKLSRRELLEILVEQSKKIDSLTEQLSIAEQKLCDKNIIIENSGSIAEAALKLNGVFEATQAACQQYMDNIIRLSKDVNDQTNVDEKESFYKAEEVNSHEG